MPSVLLPLLALLAAGPQQAPTGRVVALQDPDLGRVEAALVFRIGDDEAAAAALLAEWLAQEAGLVSSAGALRLEGAWPRSRAREGLQRRLALLHEQPLEPQALERARRAVVLRAVAARRAPGALAATEVERRVMGLAAGPDPDARLAALEALDADALEAARATLFCRQRAWCALAGPQPEAELRALATAALATLPEGQALPAPPAPPYLEPPRLQVELVERSGAERTRVHLAAPGARRLGPDAAAHDVFSAALRRGVRLAAREELAAELDLRVAIEPGFRPEWERIGRFEYAVDCPHEDVPRAIEALVRQLREALEPLHPDELGEIVAELRAGLRPRGVRDALARALELALHGYPPDHWTRYERSLRALTSEATAAAVARHLDPQRLVVVVVGPTAQLAGPLARVGRVRTAPPAPAALAERMFAALGGPEPWRAARFVELLTVLRGPDGRPLELRTLRDLDAARLRLETLTPFEGALTLSGGVARQRAGGRVALLPVEARERLEREAWYDPLALLRQVARGGPGAVREVGSRRFELVEGPAAGVWVELGPDDRPARIGAREGEREVLFLVGPWTAHDALLAPATLERLGEDGWTRELRRLESHPTLEDALFERP